MVQPKHKPADGFVPPSSLRLDELLHRCRIVIPTGVASLQQFLQDLIGLQSGFLFRKHAYLRVELQFIEMLADELKTKAVQGPNMRGFKQRQLFLPASLAGVLFGFLHQPSTDALSHFGGGGLSKRHHEDLI